MQHHALGAGLRIPVTRVPQRMFTPAAAQAWASACSQLARLDGIAQRRQAGILGADQRAPEAALLRDVDGGDRSGVDGAPGIEAFENLPGAVRQGEHASVIAWRVERACVEHCAVDADSAQHQGQRQTDRPPADDGNLQFAVVGLANEL
jgi:hypothetical protein